MPEHDTIVQEYLKSLFSQVLEHDPQHLEYILEHLPATLSHFGLNLARIGSLFKLAAQELDDHRQLADDILRSIVVLLHAVLEDTLREIIRPKLSKCSTEILDNIPLTRTSPTGQPKKFSLGELSKHRGKSVNEVIQESTNQFLNHTSFSSCDDIADMLNMLRVNTSHLEQYFAPLAEMISRRHQIVHKADRANGPESHPFAPVNPRDVMKWSRIVVSFITDLFVEMYVSEADPDKKKQLRSLLKEKFSKYKV